MLDLGERLVPRMVALCLVVLAVNAVLIQTVFTDQPVAKNAVRAGVFGVALLVLALRWKSLPRWPLLLVTWCALLFVLRANQDQLSIIFVVVLALLAGQVSERSLLKWSAIASMVGLALIFAMVVTGLSYDVVIRSEFEGVQRARHNYGVASVPFLFNVAFGSFALTVLYAKKYLSRAHLILSVLATLAAATFLYGQADTRGGFATFLLFLVLLVVVPRLRLAWLYAVVPIVLLAVSLWLGLGHVDPWINRVLSQRPMYYAQFLNDVHWTDVLLSASVKQIDYPVDNSYLHLLVGCSVVVLALFLWLYARAVLDLMRHERYSEVALMTATAVYCASESLLVRIENGFIVFVWYLVLQYGAGIRDRGRAEDSDVGRPVRPRPGIGPSELETFTTSTGLS